jgi:hypothetical protein
MNTLPFYSDIVESFAELLHLNVVFATIGDLFFQSTNKPWFQALKRLLALW